MAVLIGYGSLSKSYGSQKLFTGIDLSFKMNEKIGLIGTNGSGKSTLLKIFSGLEQADTGELIRKKLLNLVYLPQHDIFDPDRTIPEILYDVLKNDLGWDKMPFSKLEQNTVFLLIMAMCQNFYAHVIEKFSKGVSFLSANFTIKKDSSSALSASQVSG